MANTYAYRGGSSVRNKRNEKRSGNLRKWLWSFPAALLLVGGGVWLTLALRDEPLPQEKDDTSPRIGRHVKEVKPATPARKGREASAGEVSAVALPKPKRPNLPQRGPHTNLYGYVINQPTSEHVITNAPSREFQSLEELVFSNATDQKIAALLLMEPGEMLVGDASSLFGRGFARQFKRALEKPIEIGPDDPPEIVELKNAVHETREELRQRLAAGEDIAQLMQDTYADMQQLGTYREQLRKQMAEFLRDRTLSKEDAEDFVKAANELLAQRGATSLKMPRFAVRRFELMEARMKGKEK